MIYHQKKLKIWNKKSVKKCEYIHQYNFWSYIRKELLICNNECNLEDLTSYEITHMIHNFLFCFVCFRCDIDSTCMSNILYLYPFITKKHFYFVFISLIAKHKFC